MKHGVAIGSFGSTDCVVRSIETEAWKADPVMRWKLIALFVLLVALTVQWTGAESMRGMPRSIPHAQHNAPPCAGVRRSSKSGGGGIKTAKLIADLLQGDDEAQRTKAAMSVVYLARKEDGGKAQLRRDGQSVGGG